MFERFKRFAQNDLGAELVEWSVVALIMVFATYALLQAAGPELNTTAAIILDGIKNLVGG